MKNIPDNLLFFFIQKNRYCVRFKIKYYFCMLKYFKTIKKLSDSFKDNIRFAATNLKKQGLLTAACESDFAFLNFRFLCVSLTSVKILISRSLCNLLEVNINV